MNHIGGAKKKGKKYSENDWIHVTIWCRPSEWDRINYLSAGAKSVSAYVLDKCLNYVGTPAELISPDEVGKSRPLCVPVEKWNIVKEKAENAGMSISKYVLAVVLG